MWVFSLTPSRIGIITALKSNAGAASWPAAGRNVYGTVSVIAVMSRLKANILFA
jgi:hypothetical protein